MACDVRVALIRKGPAVEQQANAVARSKQAVGIAFYIRRPFESNRFGPTEDLELRLDLPVPAIDNELINILRNQTMLRQGGNNCVKIIDGLIPRIVAPFLLLDAKDESSVLHKCDRPVMRQLDAADTHNLSISRSAIGLK